MNILTIIPSFLLAIYPAVFLYSYNINELALSELLIIVAIAICLTIFIFLIIYALNRNIQKTALISAIFIIFFFGYGAIFDKLSALFVLKHRHFLPIILFIEGYLAYFIWITKKQYLIKYINGALAIASIFLIFINLINIVPSEIKKAEDYSVKQNTYSGAALSTNRPDIYYIILDEYAGADTIKKLWGYDNSQFLADLKKDGFFIADQSESSYGDTYHSLASSLNMEYVDPWENELSLYRMIGNNKVAQILRSMGYKIVVFNKSHLPLKPEIADYNLTYHPGNSEKKLSGFQELIIENSMLKPFKYLFEVAFSPYSVDRNKTLFAFNKLRNLNNIESPKFVYAHIMSPHLPFVFDKDGEEVDPINVNNWKDKKYYLEQYIYISKEIKKTVESIIKNSEKKPIIIVQSDHGPRAQYLLAGKMEEVSFIPQDAYKDILNAYYLPNFDFDRNLINNEISPVNTFRLILNFYFNENFEMLENYR